MNTTEYNRNLMKSRFALASGMVSDQAKGVPFPPLQKPYDKNAKRMPLPKPDGSVLGVNDLDACLRKRRSRRKFTDESLTLPELSYLLWATQGVDETIAGGYCTLRPTPSAGARHPFETYLAINRVEGIAPAMYRYLPLSHELLLEFEEKDMDRSLTKACLGQSFVGDGAVVFIWTCIPYRCEWRYHVLAHKVMLIDAGHLCQNLYLVCEAMGCGTCAIGAYDQAAMDAVVRVDGHDEYVVYLAPVGRLA